jgi:hypothetical protein
MRLQFYCLRVCTPNTMQRLSFGPHNTSVWSDRLYHGLTIPANDMLLVSSQQTVVFFHEKKEVCNLCPFMPRHLSVPFKNPATQIKEFKLQV